MLESVIATLLNRYLGKYVQDLDSHNLNLSIFDGDVELKDLKLQADILAEFDVPLEIRSGSIGRLSLSIPWTSLTSQPVVVTVEDVFLLATPILDSPYDADKELLLLRRAKKRKIESLENSGFLGKESPQSRGFMENLMATIVNNLQVFIRSVHIRYEDTVSIPDCPFACGLCLQSLSAETTTSKWKPGQVDGNASAIFKLLRLESFSAYWNPYCSKRNLVRTHTFSHKWKSKMREGLQTFAIDSEEFDFVVKPLTCKAKVIMNKSVENRVPRLLIDLVLQDAATQLSRQQYLAFLNLRKSLERMEINRRFRKYHPGKPLMHNVKAWWHYAMEAVTEEFIRCYSWERISMHRQLYRQYKELFKEKLRGTSDAELEIELIRLEDQLNVTNIVLAREQARIELSQSEPSKADVQPSKNTWWSWFGLEDTNEVDATAQPLFPGERGVWSQLTPEEKERLYKAIGYNRNACASSNKPIQYIEHKVNLTLANCSLSLLNYGQDVLVLTLTQLLLSGETRPHAKAIKMSARTDSFVLEGLDNTQELVPIVTPYKATQGGVRSDVLALDLEKNPLGCTADYGCNVRVRAMEMAYNQHAISEVVSWFHVSDAYKKIKSKDGPNVMEVTRAAVEYAILQHTTLLLNVDMSAPHILFPEFGTIYNSTGNVLMLDLGHLKVTTELQEDSSALEDATRSEVEERLYDRFHIGLSDFQLLFCPLDKWQSLRMQAESSYHLIPQLNCGMVFSTSIKPDYMLMPRHKVNVSIPSLKLNVSDRKMTMLADYIKNVPLPRIKEADVSDGKHLFSGVDPRECIVEPSVKQLEEVYKLVTKPEKERPESRCITPLSPISDTSLELEKYFSNSEDESKEEWAYTVDLPGFDDNISASNRINVLCRFTIGETLVGLSRSSDHDVDRPYLMLRLERMCLDVALMTYGPALQLTLFQLQLLDKLTPDPQGHYLELIKSDEQNDVITLLYRKVRANCPEFRSYFHSVEQSMVLSVASVSVNFHRGAALTLSRYLQYTLGKLSAKVPILADSPLKQYPVRLSSWLISGPADPPVPPGATKFSYSLRMQQLEIYLCDRDLQFVDVKVQRMEVDGVFKANEKKIMRCGIGNVLLEDVSASSLYQKVLCVEEEPALEMQWIKHSTKAHKQEDIENLELKTHASLKVKAGKLQVVILVKFLEELKHFLEPFFYPEITVATLRSCEKYVEQKMQETAQQGMKLSLDVNVSAPVILLPQKPHSPNVLILNLGHLSIENFFKDIEGNGTIDNMLVKLSSLQASRAIMGMSGTVLIKEPIIEPVNVSLDVKRALGPTKKEQLLYDINGSLEVITVFLGQRDLGLLIAIYQENLMQAKLLESRPHSRMASPMDSITPVPVGEFLCPDAEAERLEAFLSQSVDIFKDKNFRFTIDGLKVTLFSDTEEDMSSPVRDVMAAITVLNLDESFIEWESWSDRNSSVKFSVSSLTVDDVREKNLIHSKIFESNSSHSLHSDGPTINVSTFPMVEATYDIAGNGDGSLDIVMEKVRVTLNSSYLVAVMKFLKGSLPEPQQIVSDSSSPNSQVFPEVGTIAMLSPSSVDSTSGYMSCITTVVEEKRVLNVTVKLRRPEVLLLADPNELHTPILLITGEFGVEVSRNKQAQLEGSASLSSIKVLSCVYTKKRQTPYVVVNNCEINCSYSWKSSEEGLDLQLKFTPLHLYFSATTVTLIKKVVSELAAGIAEPDLDQFRNERYPHREYKNLWTPRRVPSIKPNLQTQIRHTCLGLTTEPTEHLRLTLPELRIIWEEENRNIRIPSIMVQSDVTATVQNWSNAFISSIEVDVEVWYHNANLDVWEPLIEPNVHREGLADPYHFVLRVFKSLPHPIASAGNKCISEVIRTESIETMKKQSKSFFETSSDEEEDDEEVKNCIIKAPKPLFKDSNRNLPLDEPEASDSEDELLQNISSSLGCTLMSDDNDEGEDSDDGGSQKSPNEGDNSEAASDDEDIPPLEEKQPQDNNEADIDWLYNMDGSLASYITLDSRDRLEVTLTSEALQALKQLVDGFSEPKELHPFYLSRSSLAKRNSLSLDNDVYPGSRIVIIESKADGSTSEVNVAMYEGDPGSIMSSPEMSSANNSEDEEDEINDFTVSSLGKPLNTNNHVVLSHMKDRWFHRLEKTRSRSLLIEIPGLEPINTSIPERPGVRPITLKSLDDGKRYHVLLSSRPHKLLTVRSPLQIKNGTPFAIGLYYQKKDLDSIGQTLPVSASPNPFENRIKFAVLDPEETYTLPLFIAYHCALFFQPLLFNVRVSDCGVFWEDLIRKPSVHEDVVCLPDDSHQKPFFLKVKCLRGPEIDYPSVPKCIPNYQLVIVPPLTIYNYLPVTCDVSVPTSGRTLKLDAGHSEHLFTVDCRDSSRVTLEVANYLGLPWKGSLEISQEMKSLKSVHMTTDFDKVGGNKDLGLLAKSKITPSVQLYLYSPYWIVNKTDIPIEIRASGSHIAYEVGNEEPFLFRFTKQTKRKVRLRAYSSSWSSAFSLETPWNAGVVICCDKERERKYRCLVVVEMSRLKLAKTVTILPYFLLSNQCPFPVSVMEQNPEADLWLSLQPNQVSPYWPTTDSMLMHMRYTNSRVVSQHFPVNQPQRTVLRLDEGSGVCVEVSGGLTTPRTITLSPYVFGAAPVRIDNHCDDLFLKVKQKELHQVCLLSPRQSVLYTWDDPTKQKELIWNLYSRNLNGFPVHYQKDGFGSEKVSFHIMRTESLGNRKQPESPVSVASRRSLSLATESSEEDEGVEAEAISVKRMTTRKDKVVVFWVSYIDTWGAAPQRVVLFTQREALARAMRARSLGELARYDGFISLHSVGLSLVTNSKRSRIEVAYAGIQNDPSIWEILPKGGSLWKPLPELLATWLEDQWLNGATSPSLKDQVQVDFTRMEMQKPYLAELKRRYLPGFKLQIRKSDQFYYLGLRLQRLQIDNHLPDAVFPVVLFSTPGSPETLPEPFLEGKMLIRHSRKGRSSLIKQSKAKVGNISVQLDWGFIMSVWGFFETWLPSKQDSEVMNQELAAVHKPVDRLKVATNQEDQGSLVEHLVVSPIVIRVSWSPRGTVWSSGDEEDGFVQFLLGSFGATLSEFKDVELTAAGLEYFGGLTPVSEVVGDVKSHYLLQLARQSYVIILGLDILGNPYHLGQSLVEGVKDLFYQPYMGALEGGEEFAVGVASGMESLLGHIIGGPASSVAAISGSIANLVTKLGFDSHYAKLRRRRLQQKSPLPATLLSAMQTFVMGVALGVSGVISQPVTGAAEEGVEGFFKGLGKGLLGLLTKPLGGVFDLVAMAFDGIHRAVGHGETPPTRFRLPRNINPWTGVSPYSAYLARGAQILRALKNTDYYYAHFPLSTDAKSDVVLITDSRILLLERCSWWGVWDIEWEIYLSDIITSPSVQGESLVIPTKDSSHREILCKDADTLKLVHEEIDRALLLHINSPVFT